MGRVDDVIIKVKLSVPINSLLFTGYPILKRRALPIEIRFCSG